MVTAIIYHPSKSAQNKSGMNGTPKNLKTAYKMARKEKNPEKGCLPRQPGIIIDYRISDRHFTPSSRNGQ
jgi:hypothetical protein